ncbi:hypothetical protein [Deinococcus radiodurans]|uniref:Uncharacterized protein n=1 Tax=Deinococcus radiodurans (strain ATCC 13939 / DSM 20539 / JCM 16871 / CCUG 27074 / LMG 4051 / NBRC 15346 / NCIMB 9279 / VKM B-1422 / R1) TaxID=243230 RepID=Q9RZ55_DEIRA|nr:hypothetical protein [Deinococcus radiodurans]AAF12335.1 hypothetical protein DR_A0099 [Deinococcus radiodurans R1 = ATCC 13939 = DSM 20539]ANC72958.1 hypothetical protein A2G07_13980 [Deinococcus radiodurans R1 = ATCC 13939 = DSM 20539]QEM72916.1 P22 coat protein - protein 5 domain protein [Deinococcus radiodurans]QIP30403.1 P22 coat protein - protein 5 domain protein [Deinococcus radiodurans]QIP33239.1 P22 coat protein - protein 5 domain protein [Deinococcus radiodurans]
MTLLSNPKIWSARLLAHLDKTFVYGAAFTNRNYEGEIKDAGTSVRILQVGDVSISDYTGTLNDPEGLNDAALELVIDQKKYFNFVVDDVEAQQSIIRLVDEGSKRAAQAMSDVRDLYVAGFHSAVDAANLVGTDATPVVVGFAGGQTKPYDAFLDLTQKLDEANIPTVDRRVVLPPWFIRALKAQFGDRGSGLGDKIALDGMAGQLDGVTIYQSNNVPNVGGEKYKIMMGKDYITFADQIVKTETYRPERKFGTGVKGLHVYGAKNLQPKGFAVGTFNKGQISK